MASANFRNLTALVSSGSVNYGSNSFKCMLLTAVPSESNLDSWVNRSDVTSETSGTGYTTGGVAVTATVSSVDTANNRVSVTFSNLSPGWTGSTISAAAAVIYQVNGSASTDKLLHMVDFGGTVSSSAGTYSVTFSTPFYITTS